jgi:hypothetical protein
MSQLSIGVGIAPVAVGTMGVKTYAAQFDRTHIARIYMPTAKALAAIGA